jgi:hypothetical protein
MTGQPEFPDNLFGSFGYFFSLCIGNSRNGGIMEQAKEVKGKALYVAIGILGVVAAVLPLAIYHLVETADTGMGMKMGMKMSMACETACTVETFVGAAIAVVAVISLFIKNLKLSIAGSAVLLVGGVATIAVPSLIGFCKSEEMACRYITEPTLTVIAVIISLFAVIRLVSGVLAIRKAAEAI